MKEEKFALQGKRGNAPLKKALASTDKLLRSAQNGMEALTPFTERIADTLSGVQERLPRIIRQDVPTLGIALSGGSARGFAYAGIFRFLEEHNVQPSVVAATSAGALFAALYIDGYSPQEFLNLFKGKDFRSFASLQIPRYGLFQTENFRLFLSQNLRHRRLESLPTPLYIAATDLDEGVCRVFDSGPLAKIVQASCSIPVLFNPVEIEGHYYVDGGVFQNLPAQAIRNKCDYLLGVHLALDVRKRPWKKSLIGVAERCFDAIFYANSAHDTTLCDTLIEAPELASFTKFNTEDAECMADIGYYLARKHYNENKDFARIINRISAANRNRKE